MRTVGARLFTGREIIPALIEALENLPKDAEPSEITAGENMQIVATFPVESGGVIVGWDTCSWDGARWEVITSR